MMKMSRWFSVTIFVLFVQWIEFTEQKALDDYILDYQEVEYNPFDLHESHMRVKRSLDTHLYLRFKAYNRDFHLKLKTAENIFSKNHMTVNEDGDLEPVDTSFIYEGSLVDDPMSSAHVAIINGTARGHIRVPGDTTYHIEPSARFFHNPGFHSVIYPEKHMNLDPYRHLRENNVGQCGNDHVKEWMNSQSHSASEIPNRARRMEETWSHRVDSFKYSENANRQKRSTSAEMPEKNTCFLYLRSDPTLWKYIKNEKYKKPASDKELSDERAKEEIQAFFASHVNAIQNIYSKTRFETYDNATAYKGITFLVQRTKIMTFKSENCGTTSETPYCKSNIDVSNFLNLNSIDNHDDFCLAFLFSYRDFTHGTLGLAWVGSASKAAGGICEKFKLYPQGDKQVGKSLNTGIVSILNYGKSVPPRVSQLTFSHECGHNFGSPHDTGKHCAPYGTSDPGSKYGNYLMFASATMGDKRHNDMFSSCSKDNITRVLDAVFRGVNGKVNCFAKGQGAFCGNGIREEGEECDCGYKEDCKDQCCHPKNDPNECTLKFVSGKKVKCSPTQGPCCSNNCEFVPEVNNQSCRPADDCSNEQFCKGNSAICLESAAKPNNSLCNSNSQVCSSGKCTGSVCESIGWSECFLTSSGNNDSPTKEELCYVSCLNKETNKCVSSFNLADVNKPENKAFKDLLKSVSDSSEPLTGIKLPAGSPCDNFRGYCDVFHLCRGVDADGPLARLKNLIFNPQTLQTVKEWIVVHWWAVMLMGIGLVVVMGVFIKVCAVHTPSSNPRKPAARKLSLPGRHRHHPDQGKPHERAAASGYGEPPPPYSGPSVGGPAHGKGPRYNHKGGKDRRREMEMQQRI